MSEGIGGLALKEPICNTIQGLQVSTLSKRGGPRKRNDARATHLEDGLHLIELSPGMLACKHLDDQAPDAPNVCLLRVRDLFDDLGGHPVDRTLERRTM